MPVANYLFTETSPSAPGTAASSQAVTGSGILTGVTAGVCAMIDDFEGAEVVADLKGPTGAAGATLQVFVQVSPDGGLNWYDAIAFPPMGQGQPLSSYRAPLSTATQTLTPIQVGKNLSPLLALGVSAGGVVNGAFTDRLRLCMTAGVGTSVGAQVIVRVCPQRSRTRETGE